MTPAEINALAGPLDADIAARPVERKPVMPPLDDDYEANPRGLDRGMAHMLGDAVILARGTDLNPVPVAWLWKFWLALKKLHILAGAPGQGKTTLAIAMAATVTIGGRWPDGTRCDAANILFWSGEDDPADTLLPRLLAAGADRDRCYFVQGSRVDGEVVPFDPARDLARLRQAIEQIGGVSLLVVDPVVSAVTGDSHKNGEVRRALQPLVDLADACNCAVLGITHFSKGGQGGDPSQRVVGSVAFTAVARVVMVAAKVKAEEEGQDVRILARAKSNIGPDDGGFEYQLEQCEPLPGIPASRIAWGRSVDGTARELLTDPDEDEGETPAEKSELAMLMWAELKDGPVSSKAVESSLVGQGYTKKQIRTAREKMFVKPQKSGMGAGWYWSLPDGFKPKPEWLEAIGQTEDALEDAQGAQLSNVGILGTFGASSEPASVEGARL
ncbi:AAA family ATPase [Pseudorhodoferax soli]|uniref:AAA domain-containing protein n=1 Tax=Pseudorhodoferax soli TaxID=545864 RepID=A0A368XB22_9BURK|nr:AAA family ATPase [Pseudorhodoferax soli]RCW65171.1 AAA domain-containing protein [Pseudorhodoferax soli]